MQKILVVEDDEGLREELVLFLRRNGYCADGVERFDHLLETCLQAKADLILLDINLPDADGQFVLKELRKVSDVPVIMITSRDNEMDELLSMHYGADHYVTKPFNTQILLAKIVAILKRTNSNLTMDKIQCGNFVLDIAKSRIERNGGYVEMTGNELRIVRLLVQNRGRIVSREEIMNALWDDEAFIDDNTLTVNMARIRKKFQELGLSEIIQTKRGQGYILDE